MAFIKTKDNDRYIFNGFLNVLIIWYYSFTDTNT